MSGASGTYVDARKAQAIGLVPPNVKKIYQVGNTSLAMALDVVRDPERLWDMQQMADQLKQHHCMFASSAVFKKVFLLELSYWTEGMPQDRYSELLHRYGLPAIKEGTVVPEVIKTVNRDIEDLGDKGLRTIHDIGQVNRTVFDGCIGCGACVEACPERALYMHEDEKGVSIVLDLSLCNGIGCRRCEKACSQKCFSLIGLLRDEANRHG
jgi:methylamine methyltransferase corrinoid protein reductive activase